MSTENGDLQGGKVIYLRESVWEQMVGITAPFCSTPAKRGRKECLNDRTPRIDQSLEVPFDRYSCLYENMF